MIYGLVFVSVVSAVAGYGLRWTTERTILPIMRNMTLAKSAALWLAIFAGLCAFAAGLQWLVEAGAL